MAANTLNGNRITSAVVTIPAWGAWYADVSIDGQITITGAATIVLNDLTLVGTVLSGGPSVNGRSQYRIVAGAGGWGKVIAKKSYSNDIGIKLSSILNDAASEAGETIDQTTIGAQTVGVQYTRPEAPAGRVLEQTVPGAWYLGEDGITRLGRRTPQALPANVTRTTPIDLARGVVELASESIAVILPGVVVDGMTAIDVVHEVSDKGGLRSTVYGSVANASTSRLLLAIRVMLDQLDPNRKFRAAWEYRVVTLAGNRANLQAVLSSSGMPDLRRVYVRPSLAGSKSTLALGARVVVMFLNADPGRPIIVAEEDPDGAGFLPVATSIDAQTIVQLGAGALAVARSGDLAGGVWPVVTTQVKVLS